MSDSPESSSLGKYEPTDHQPIQGQESVVDDVLIEVEEEAFIFMNPDALRRYALAMLNREMPIVGGLESVLRGMGYPFDENGNVVLPEDEA